MVRGRKIREVRLKAGNLVVTLVTVVVVVGLNWRRRRYGRLGW